MCGWSTGLTQRWLLRMLPAKAIKKETEEKDDGEYEELEKKQEKKLYIYILEILFVLVCKSKT